MYVYFDKNGILKEIITERNARVGDYLRDKIYVYWDGVHSPTQGLIQYELPDGSATTETQFYVRPTDSLVGKELPDEPVRNLKYFSYNHTYEDDGEQKLGYLFYEITLPSAVLNCYTNDIKTPNQNNLVRARIRWVGADIDALGAIPFSVESTIGILQDNSIGQSQYNYLLEKIASYSQGALLIVNLTGTDTLASKASDDGNPFVFIYDDVPYLASIKGVDDVNGYYQFEIENLLTKDRFTTNDVASYTSDMNISTLIGTANTTNIYWRLYEDVANKSTTMDQYSNKKYPTTKLMYDYILSRITLISTPFPNLAALESEIYNGGGGAFALDGIYSVNIGDGTKYDKALVLISDLSGNNGFHATVFNGSFIEMLTGTVEEGTGHLVVPRTQKKYDLTKIGLANNGTLSGLSTTDKSTLVAAINEIYTFLGSTNGSALVGFDTATKDVVHCLNEAREMIRQIVSGSIPAGAATHATNATNDEDGNRIKTTYAKLGADHQTFSGKNTFEDNVKINANTYVVNDFSVDGSVDMGSLEVENTAKFYGNVIIPIGTNDNNPLRKDQFNQFKSDLEDGTEVVAKATGDGSGNTIKTFYGHSFDIVVDQQAFKYTFQLKDATGTVLNQKTIDLPIESLVVSGSYDAVNQKIVLTLQNGSTIDIPVGDLVAGLQTEITSQSPLESDLVSDTNQNHKFVTAGEKAQISTNASDIASLEARMDDYSYAEMVYDAQDESITVTGLALSYDGDDEELIIIR